MGSCGIHKAISQELFSPWYESDQNINLRLRQHFPWANTLISSCNSPLQCWALMWNPTPNCPTQIMNKSWICIQSNAFTYTYDTKIRYSLIANMKRIYYPWPIKNCNCTSDAMRVILHISLGTKGWICFTNALEIAHHMFRRYLSINWYYHHKAYIQIHVYTYMCVHMMTSYMCVCVHMMTSLHWHNFRINGPLSEGNQPSTLDSPHKGPSVGKNNPLKKQTFFFGELRGRGAHVTSLL